MRIPRGPQRFGAPAAAAAATNTQGLTTMDALSYLREVKEHFKNDKAVYDVFLEIMKEFKARRCAPTHPHRPHPSVRNAHAPLTLALHVTPIHSIHMCPRTRGHWLSRLNPGIAALHIAMPELSLASDVTLLPPAPSRIIRTADRHAVSNVRWELRLCLCGPARECITAVT